MKTSGLLMYESTILQIVQNFVNRLKQTEDHQARVTQLQSWYNNIACRALPNMGVERVNVCNGYFCCKDTIYYAYERYRNVTFKDCNR